MMLAFLYIFLLFLGRKKSITHHQYLAQTGKQKKLKWITNEKSHGTCWVLFCWPYHTIVLYPSYLFEYSKNKRRCVNITLCFYRKCFAVWQHGSATFFFFFLIYSIRIIFVSDCSYKFNISLIWYPEMRIILVVKIGVGRSKW